MMMISLLMLYILQWNARSLIANGQEFKRFVDVFKDKPELLCVQETWLKTCFDFMVRRYERIRQDRHEKSGGGCATFVRSDVQYQQVEVFPRVCCSKGVGEG